MREDWLEVQFGEVCHINMGQSPPSSTYNTKKIGLPFFQGKAEFTELYPIAVKWCTEPKKIANKGDILISVRAPVGSTNVADQKCAIGRGLAAISFKYSNSYLWYYLKSIEKNLDNQGTGTTFKAISGNVLKSQVFPLPPLPIQRAIVAKIENLFISLDKGIADLKKAQEQLKVYRQAVLKKAFEGEWELVKLNSVVDELSQGWSPKCKNISSLNGEEWAVIKTSAIQHGAFVENENKVLPDNLEPRKQHEIKVGDILITRAGPRSRVGVCCLVKQTRAKLINCDKVYRLRLSEKILNDFFMFKMNSSEFLTKIEDIKTGGNDSGVNLTQNRFLNLEFGLPTIDKQKQIIKEIESRLSVCDKVEQNITEGLEKAEALRQSILKKAFEGRLLSEAEIEKCKQEVDYEPASVLLEKIKNEKKK